MSSSHTPQPPGPDPLDQLLHALGDATPTPGFEARLHTRLHAQRHASPRPRSRRHTRLLWLPLPLAAIVLLLVALHPRESLPPRPPVRSTPAVSLAVRTPPVPPSVAAPASRPAPRVHARPPALTLAQQETLAPSLPPPALPISPDERNIARFRSLHSAVSLAALSSEAVLAHHVADQRDLHDFFDPNHQEN